MNYSPKSENLRAKSQTIFSLPSTSKCKSDPQPYVLHREPASLESERDFYHLPHSCMCNSSSDGRTGSNKEFLKTLCTETAAEKRMQEKFLEFTNELEKLSSENIQLKKKTIETDSNFIEMMGLMGQLQNKENEIEELRSELSQLSEQISMSTAKEKEYINNARSCMYLENQIKALEKELFCQKEDFEQLSFAHAACPTPEEMDSAINEVESAYKIRLADVNDQLSERDRLIAKLEESIATKDEELKAMSGELMRQQSDWDVSEMQRLDLETRLGIMESVVQDREKLIGKMKTLMTRKSFKVNLLHRRVKELELKLEACQKQLGKYHYRLYGYRCPVTVSNDFEQTRTKSQGNLYKSSKNDWNRSYDGAGDFYVDEDDSEGLLNETSKLESDIADASIKPTGYDPAGLLSKISIIKSKIRRKLDKEIRKRNLLSETIGDSRRRFHQTQTEIEEIRKHQENVEDSRQQITSRVDQEKLLSRIMECSENECRATSAKIWSFERALRNLENLEAFIAQTTNKM